MKKNGNKLFIAMFLAPIFLFFAVALPFFYHYRTGDREKLRSLTLLSDGESVFTATTSFYDIKNLQIKGLNLKTKETFLQRIPSHFLGTCFLYPGDHYATAVIMQGETEGIKPYEIFALSRSGEMIPQGTLYGSTAFAEPIFWNGRTFMTGLNRQGRHVLAILKEKQSTWIDLENLEAISGNIRSVHFDQNSIMPVLDITLYTGRRFFAGLFLNADGVLPVYPVDSRSNALRQLCLDFFGSAPMLQLVQDGPNRYNLATFSWKDGGQISNNAIQTDPSILKPFSDYHLYNAQMNIIDAQRVLVVGGTTSNPAHSRIIGLLFDRRSQSITELPERALQNLSLNFFSENPYISLNADTLVLNQGKSIGAAALNLKSGECHYVSETTFIGTDIFEELQSYVLYGHGSYLLIIAFLWLLLPIWGTLLFQFLKKILGRGSLGEQDVEPVRAEEPEHKAQAVVMSALPTGHIVDGKAEMWIVLRVSRPEDESYSATVTKVVPAEVLPVLQPGRVLNILYSDEDPQNIVLLIE